MVGIAMLVTIPRTAATHELGVQTIFSQIPAYVTMIIFFGIAFFFAIDKSHMIDKLGKYLTPGLFIILVAIIAKGVISSIGSPVDTEIENSFSNSFIGAYQTGDVFT